MTQDLTSSRRGFLLAAAGASRVLGANDRINVGYIGLGGNGGGIAQTTGGAESR